MPPGTGRDPSEHGGRASGRPTAWQPSGHEAWRRARGPGPGRSGQGAPTEDLDQVARPRGQESEGGTTTSEALGRSFWAPAGRYSAAPPAAGRWPHPRPPRRSRSATQVSVAVADEFDGDSKCIWPMARAVREEQRAFHDPTGRADQHPELTATVRRQSHLLEEPDPGGEGRAIRPPAAHGRCRPTQRPRSGR